MLRRSSFDPLYAAPLVLWVEDTQTEQYLLEVWKTSSTVLRIHIAGNNDAVHALVSTAEREGFTQVFGLVDRDFGTTNKPDWSTKRVFRLHRHEIENYLLDPVDLSNCLAHNRKRTVADIAQKLTELASQQPAWLAYRKIVRKIEKELGHGQPGVPPCANIATIEAAVQQIETTPWIATLDNRASAWTVPGKIASEVATAHSEFDTILQAGTWIDDFSGKEIFRPIRDYLYSPKPGSGPDHDADFAAEIGIWQFANNRVPTDIADLLAVLRQRVGLSP